MESKHTPGPWAVTKKFEVGPISNEDDQSNGMVIPVADVFGENRKDDARLIAAAPDLLKACSCALGWVTGNMDGDADLGDAIELIREAIAKAEGTS